MVGDVQGQIVFGRRCDSKSVLFARRAFTEETAWLRVGTHLVGLTIKVYPGMDGMQASSCSRRNNTALVPLNEHLYAHKQNVLVLSPAHAYAIKFLRLVVDRCFHLWYLPGCLL